MNAPGDAPRRPCWGRPAGIYLCLGLLGGLALLVFTPPMQVPDEWAHFERAYTLANGTWVGKGMGGVVPDQLHRLVWETEDRIGLPSRAAVAPQLMVEHLRELSRVSLRDARPEFVRFPTALYSPVPYVGMSAGIALSQRFSDRALTLFYAGRLGALLAAVALSLLAIMLTPFGKWFFGALALTPVVLFQSCGMSADSMTMALALCLASLVMRFGYGSAAVGGPQVMMLALIASALGLCKQGYLPLALMVWLIPPERFASPGHRRAARIGVPLLAAAALAVWTVLALRYHYEPPFSGTDAKAQLAFIAAHPLGYLATLARDVLTKGPAYLHELIGTVGYKNIRASVPLVLAHFGLLLVIARHDGPATAANDFTRRLLALVIIAGGTAWVMTLLYLWWTPVGGDLVDGLQGRYFLPLLVLLPFAIAARESQRLHAKNERRAVLLLWFWGGFLVANTVNRVISHYYSF
jgi:uncharacterized membrane protein